MNNRHQNILTSLEILCSIRDQASTEEKNPNIFSPEIPEMQVFKDLSGFSFKDFLFKWNLLVTASNIYNLFSCFYFLGVKTFPNRFWLEFEILFEGVLIVDLAVRGYFLRRFKVGDSHLLSEDLTILWWVLLFLASVPYSTIFVLLKSVQLESLRFLRMLKILRIFQIHKFFTFLRLVFHSNPAISVIQGAVLVFFSQHCSAMLYLLVTERVFKDDQEKYLEAFYWATQTLTGIVLSEAEDSRYGVKIIAILVMVTGVILYGVLFVQLNIQLSQNYSSRSAKSFWNLAVHVWSKERKVPKDLEYKIETFALIQQENKIQELFMTFPKEMPLSLLTELGIFRFKSLVSKVKLFELSEPSFVLSVLRCLKEELFLSEDLIIRSGDQSDCMFFIMNGMVEIIAKDGKNRIALMAEGEYFGEIGILMNIFRTVSVRAVEPCLLAKISKENMMKILENFPEHHKFLLKIAKQRLKTSCSDDIELDHDLVEDNCSSSDSDQEGDLDCPEYYSTAEHELKSWILKMITVPESRSKKGSSLIDPLSAFFYVWMVLMGLAFTFCLFEIPFVIAFGLRPGLVFIDFLAYLVFLGDILVSYKSSYLTRYKKYVNNREDINRTYLDRYFILDVLSVVPIDWAYYSLQSASPVVYYFKAFRLLKIARVASLVSVIQEHSKFSERMIKYLIHVYFFFAVIHISACILSNFFTSEQVEYVDCLYWSISIYSQTSYADINPNQSGKIISIILSNISKIISVYFFIESVHFILEKNHFELEFLKRFKNMEEWMNHASLTPSLKNSIKQYLLLKWEKLLGLEDEEILKMLPDSLSTDLRLFLFRGIIESGLFPKDETGALLALTRKCNIIIVNQGINVFNKGEIGLEMYFILEGTAEVVDSDLTVFQEILSGGFFGELALINEQPSLRMATVSAKTHLTLAVLNMMDFKDIVKTHPTFGRKVLVIAEERKRMRILRNFDKFGEGESIEQFKISGTGVDTHVDRTHIYTSFTSRELEIEVKNIPLVEKIRENKMNEIVYFMFWAWNVFFIPVQLAFEVEYVAPFFIMESLSMFFYALVAIYYVLEYQMKKNSLKLSETSYSNKVPSYLKLKIIYNMVLSLPFSMILSQSGIKEPKILVIFLCYIRISNILYIFPFFSKLKKKWISWYLFLEVLKIFTVTLTVAHIADCLFITLSREKQDSWITSEKVGSDPSLYLNAFYWSIGTLTHVTQGDIKSETIQEKSFNIFYSYLSFFLFIIFFGELVSLINVSKNVLKDQMFADFNKTTEFLKKKKIQKVSKQIDSYFNFIWEKHRGLQEKLVLKGLPFHLQSEVFIYKYSEILMSSDILMDDGVLNEGLVRSLCRFMKFHYYFLGDVILRIDDMHQKLFFILSGEVNIISFLGDSVICVLGPGNYFGETSVLYNTPYRTASVVATMFTHTFVIEDQHINIVFQAFPEWKARLAYVAGERVKSAFNIPECHTFANVNDMMIDHQLKRKMTQKTDYLISKKIAEAKEGAMVEKRQTVDVFHFSLIVYSCFTLPFMVMFYETPPLWMVIMELVYIFESCIFICFEISRLKSSQLGFCQNFCRVLMSKFMIIDLVSTFPCNMIIVLSEIDSNRVLIRFLRLNRLISCLRIRSFLTDLSINYKRVNKWVSIIEETIYLLLFIHWTACLFHRFNDCGGSDTYTDSLYFTVSIVSATGHTNAHPCHSGMMILVIITGTISTSALALMFGILSLIFPKKTESPVQIFDSLCQDFSFFLNKNVPKILKHRFQTFAKFRSSLQHFYGEIIIEEIYQHLPHNIVHKLVFERSRHKLKKVPFLHDHYQEILFKRIALSLKVEVYLPGDYLIYKDDQGDEMYFIDIGVVNIVSPDNSKIIKSLRKGDFVGEMALINNSPRICSVVASTLCLAYVLKKHDFDSILKSFPEVLESIKKYSEIRSRETTSVTKNPEKRRNDDEVPKQVFSHLSTYSIMASSFAVITRNQDKFSLITGMKNLKKCQDLESLAVKNSGSTVFRRRPSKRKPLKRRKSQEALGKSLVLDRFQRKSDWDELAGSK